MLVSATVCVNSAQMTVIKVVVPVDCFIIRISFSSSLSFKYYPIRSFKIGGQANFWIVANFIPFLLCVSNFIQKKEGLTAQNTDL